MEREVPAASSPQLCEKGCGFFANVGCGGLCSKCHRDAAQAASSSAVALSKPAPTPGPVADAPPKATQEAKPSPSDSGLPASSASAEASTSGSAPPQQKQTTRCLVCNKKVGLTGFKCKCEGLFCGQHRYAESHNCAFDYKASAAAKLAAANPKVQASKIQKI